VGQKYIITACVSVVSNLKIKTMKVKELKEKLNEFPDNMDVFVSERVTDFSYGLVNSVYIKEINFVEEPGGEVLSCDKVVIIDED
jgi:hypothetical protein